ncbi:MAG: hypothetical protein Q9169_003850 [Polycauliona sp. 2 TL-2023]
MASETKSKRHAKSTHKTKKTNHEATASTAVEDDELERAEHEYEMALKQAEILRLRHMTKKLERELQSSSRASNGNDKSHDHALTISDDVGAQSAAAGTKRKASPAPETSERQEDVPEISSQHMPAKLERSRSIYEGKTYRELKKWLSGLEGNFQTLQIQTDDAAKIREATGFLTSSIAYQWEMHVQKSSDAVQYGWKDFVEFLESHFGDPKERKLKTLQVYHDALPKPSQSVHSFKAYLARLEEELPPYTKEQSDLHLQLRLRMAAQRRASGQNVLPQHGGHDGRDPEEDRSAPWSAPSGPKGPLGGTKGGQRGAQRGSQGGTPRGAPRGAPRGPQRGTYFGENREERNHYFDRVVYHGQGRESSNDQHREGENSSQYRDWQNGGPKRPYAEDQENTNAHAGGAKRQRHAAHDYSIKEEPNESLHSMNQTYQ